MPGCRGILVQRRVGGNDALFTLMTLWDSIESIKAFVGENYEHAGTAPTMTSF